VIPDDDLQRQADSAIAYSVVWLLKESRQDGSDASYMNHETLYINRPAIWVNGATIGQDRGAIGLNR
jgi:hypothetical protein